MNLYCRLVSRGEDSADYSVGPSLEQLDGLARFYSDERRPEIIRPWGEMSSYERGKLAYLYLKYEKQLKSGDFPERMSRLIG